MPRIDEASLIVAAKAGDPAAFGALYAHHHRAVTARLVYLCGRDVDDLVQDTFERAYRSLRSFRGDALRSWLLTIATHLAHSAQRAVRRSTWRLFAGDAEAHALADRVTTTLPERLDVHEALAQLSPRLREAVVLSDVEGQTLAEIARDLALPLPTVAARVRRGRKLLAAVLVLLCAFAMTAAWAWLRRVQPELLPSPSLSLATTRALKISTPHEQVRTMLRVLRPKRTKPHLQRDFDEPFGDVIEVARPSPSPPLFDVDTYRRTR